MGVSAAGVGALFGRTEPAPTSPDWDGFDFSANPRSGYQMVPVLGDRKGEILMGGGRVSVISANQDIVLLSSPPVSRQQKITFDHKPQTIRDFTIHGVREGRTAIVAIAPDDTLLHSFVVSVKKPRPINYNLHILRDAFRPGKDTSQERTLGQLTNIMKLVEQAYLNQANVVLKKKRENILQLGVSVGDPFHPLNKDFITGDTADEAVRIQLREDGFHDDATQTVQIISTWNIRDDDQLHQVQGLTERFRRLSYVERLDGGVKESCLIAHELGHSLGLGHNAAQGSLMIAASGANPSFRMIRKEIDFLNGSAGGQVVLNLGP